MKKEKHTEKSTEQNKEIWELICRLALEAGFADWGAVAAEEVSTEQKCYYNAREAAGYFAELDYLKRNCSKRFNPALLVEGTKSIVLFLVPFGQEMEMGNPPYIAQYARGKDYHKVIKERLFTILAALKEQFPEISGRPFVDSAPVLERYWAMRAGLGFIGKNNFLISPKCGIRNFICSLFLNVELPPPDAAASADATVSASADADATTACTGIPATANAADRRERTQGLPSCGACCRCLDACPTGALEAPFVLNANKCTSYLTIEKRHIQQQVEQQQAGQRQVEQRQVEQQNVEQQKVEQRQIEQQQAGQRQIEQRQAGGLEAHNTESHTLRQHRRYNRMELLKEENAIPVNGWLFGCDCCMNACPWNSKNISSWPEFLPQECEITYKGKEAPGNRD